MKQIIAKQIEKEYIIEKTTATKIPDGWIIKTPKSIRRLYKDVIKMKDKYLIAYLSLTAPRKSHIYNCDGPICKKNGELLECTSVKYMGRNILEIQEDNGSKYIVIGKDVFNVSDIQYIEAEGKYLGVVFLEVGGSLYFKESTTSLRVIIEQECKGFSSKYKCLVDVENGIDAIISITAKMANEEEQNYLIQLKQVSERNRYCHILQIYENVDCFFPENLQFVLTQADENGRRKLYNMREKTYITTELPADGVEITENHIFFFEYTSNGKWYTQIYNKFTGERIFTQSTSKKEKYTNIVISEYDILILEKKIDERTVSYLVIEDNEVPLGEDIKVNDVIKQENYIIIKLDSGKNIIIWITKNDIQNITMPSEVEIKYCSPTNLIIKDGKEEYLYTTSNAGESDKKEE